MQTLLFNFCTCYMKHTYGQFSEMYILQFKYGSICQVVFVTDKSVTDADTAIYTTWRLSIMANGTIAFDTLTTSDSVNTGTAKSIDTSYIFNGVNKVWFTL